MKAMSKIAFKNQTNLEVFGGRRWAVLTHVEADHGGGLGARVPV